MQLEVYKKSDFYEDYISSQKEYYERENADAYFAERLAEKDKEIALLKERICNGDVSRLTWIDDCAYWKSKAQRERHQKYKLIAELKQKKIKFLQVTAIRKNCNKCADGIGKVFDENLDELKADYKEACDRLQTANLIKDEQLAATRHNKYKRCLAMAKWCHNESLWWYSKGYGFEKYDKFWEKWEKRWLEIAEQFKEAK